MQNLKHWILNFKTLNIKLGALKNKFQKKILNQINDWGFKKTGGDLLSRFRSTIGARGLNFCVRNGNRWAPLLKPP